jgi:hypothetical protein
MHLLSWALPEPRPETVVTGRRGARPAPRAARAEVAHAG